MIPARGRNWPRRKPAERGVASADEPRRAQRGAAASPDADLRRATQRLPAWGRSPFRPEAGMTPPPGRRSAPGRNSASAGRKPNSWGFLWRKGKESLKNPLYSGAFFGPSAVRERGRLSRTHKSKKYLPFSKKSGPGKRTGSSRIVQCAQVREKLGISGSGGA